MCTIFAQLVFTGAKNGHFSKSPIPVENSGLRPIKKNYMFQEIQFLVFRSFAISEPGFFFYRHPSKNPISIVFCETYVIYFFSKVPFLKRGFWEVRKKKITKKEVTNLWKRKQKTLIWTKIRHKNHPLKNHFYNAKMAPKKVDKLITFEVAKLITSKGQKVETNNSPAYMYIYADKSNNGTQISEEQVKQRDARTLNNGTRLVSRYKNSGFALFWVYAISDAGSSV